MIKYIKVYKWANKTSGRVKLLRILDMAAVLLVAAAFGYYLVQLYLTLGLEPAVRGAVFAALPFLLFSIFRRSLNSPRPYEDMDFVAMGFALPSKSRGASFPSRHVFSAALIGTMMIARLPLIGIVTLVLALALSVLRVLRGVHYMKDVVAGLIVGVIGALPAIFLL